MAEPPVVASPSPATAPDRGAQIGQAARPVRALAFAGGAYDTAMQLGVAHALLVSRARPPEVVAGVSAGAINAVALAEILQAQAAATPPGATPSELAEARLLAQVAKFREVLESYQSSAGVLLNACLPDPYQIDAHRALEPFSSPLHARDERQRRREAMSSRAGLIRLANDLLSVDVTLASVTRMVRAALGVRAALAYPLRKSGVSLVTELAVLWALLLANAARLAPLAGRFLWPGRPMRPAERSWTAPLDRLESHTGGGTAGQLLSRPRRWLGRFRALCRSGLGFLTIVIALVTAPLWGVLAALAGLLPLVRRWAVSTGGWLFRRFLGGYDVAKGLLPPNPLRDMFVGLFDPAYYGPLELDRAIGSALGDRDSYGREGVPTDRKALAGYARHHLDPVRVEVIVADIATGMLVPAPQDASVVDALVAASALPPLFEAQQLRAAPPGGTEAVGAGDGRWFVDGSAVANEPTGPLLDVLRERLHREATVVNIYTVNALPLTRGRLRPTGGDRQYDSLIDIASRALALQRFRDATLDRNSTELVTRTLPEGRARVSIPGVQRPLVRAHVFPIELDAHVEATRRILAAQTEDERRRIVTATVADGCRATLEATRQDVIARGEMVEWPSRDGAAGPVSQGEAVDPAPRFVRCASAMRHRLGADDPALPGSDEGVGPGLREVCAACRVSADERAPGQALRIIVNRRYWPNWEGRTSEDVSRRAVRNEHDQRVRRALTELASSEEHIPVTERWPATRGGQPPGRERPLVNLLFSGGVFRGVFLMGVVNALDLAGIQPDIIAGSSVGSITAAMAARVFAEREPAARQKAIAQLAATFISIDRLVLTDRLADFVRNLTLRAGQSGVSIREVDRVFRAYDRQDARSYESDVRRVLAAIERLFYVDPFEVRDLVKEIRAGNSGAAMKLLRQYAQAWLSRGGVALEVFGAEPLDLLIRHRVLDGREASEARLVPIDTFLKSGIYFFATATNITKGRLEILGVEQFLGREYRAMMLEALLASSAFPGVFRPRRSGDIMPFSRDADQYIDGGVMDNLPLDAVARFLNVASEVGLIARRPVVNGQPVPHLLFAGSLEVNRRSLDPAGVSGVVSFWGHSARHAREFGYNRKIDNYRQMQRDLRMIHRAHPRDGAQAPLDLEVVVAKPEWLCGTFAFHPMLGFRRRHQVESIAHGCMSTLRTLSRLANENGETASWLAAWGVNAKLRQPRPWCRRNLTRDEKRRGDCWWTPVQCPFSRAALEKHQGTLFSSASSIEELSAIHQSCGEPQTHRARH